MADAETTISGKKELITYLQFPRKGGLPQPAGPRGHSGGVTEAWAADFMTAVGAVRWGRPSWVGSETQTLEFVITWHTEQAISPRVGQDPVSTSVSHLHGLSHASLMDCRSRSAMNKQRTAVARHDDDVSLPRWAGAVLRGSTHLG